MQKKNYNKIKNDSSLTKSAIAPEKFLNNRKPQRCDINAVPSPLTYAVCVLHFNLAYIMCQTNQFIFKGTKFNPISVQINECHPGKSCFEVLSLFPGNRAINISLQ